MQIFPQKNQLAQICSQIPSTELKLIVRDVIQYINTGELEKNSYFYRFVEATNAKYDIPKDYRMIERAILVEGSRRYYNNLESTPTGSAASLLF